MATRRNLLSSSVGTKLAIALTGLAMVGFLIGHLGGNLLILVGSGPFNDYGHAMISNPLLVPAELGLLAILLVHVYKTIANYRRNRAARPTGYVQKTNAGDPSRKSLASTSMIVTGLVVLGFLVIHIRTFKYGAYYAAAEPDVRDLHRLVIETFTQPLWVAFYVACMAVVGLHLRHGIASAFQSLGVDAPGLTPRLVAGGTVLAILLGAGFALIPLWIYFLGAPA